MADETSTPATQPAPRMVSRIWTAGLAVLRWRVVGLMLVLTWARLLFGPELVASWIQATEFTDDGPVSRGILTYSQSINPGSPHHADMTKLFSQEQWVDLPFHEGDVAAATLSSLHLSEGKDDCKKNGWRTFAKPTFDNQGDCVSYMNELRKRRLDEIKARDKRGDEKSGD